MASPENIPASPKSPRSNHPRSSLAGVFEGLSIENTPTSAKGKERARPRAQGSEHSGSSSLRGSLSRRWPPSFDEFDIDLDNQLEGRSSPSLTLRMSDLYCVHGDNWAKNPSVEDLPVDVSDDFKFVAGMMEEMAKVIHRSNQKARKGLGLEETLKICRLIFEGVEGLEYSDRTPEYQEKLEKLVKKELDAAPNHVIRSRREVVQYAAAFYHIVNCFVVQNQPMSERTHKDTHAILVKGIGAGSAGSLALPKPNIIPTAMRSMVQNLDKDLAAASEQKKLDPFALAAKYCDRFVNIHPFRDGNSRMCRLILNAILIKYAGIVVNVGEHNQSRDEYLDVARESHQVGGHAGALGSMVLREAKHTLRRMKEKLLFKTK